MDSHDICDDLDFNQKIKSMPDRDLLEFVALQSYTTTRICPRHDARISALESKDSKMYGLSGGIGGVIGGIIAGIAAYFTK